MSSSNMSRYSYVLEIIKQIKGFYGYLALSAIIRVVNKFSSASVGIAAACFIGKILDGDMVSIKTISTILLLLIIIKGISKNPRFSKSDNVFTCFLKCENYKMIGF